MRGHALGSALVLVAPVLLVLLVWFLLPPVPLDSSLPGVVQVGDVYIAIGQGSFCIWWV